MIKRIKSASLKSFKRFLKDDENDIRFTLDFDTDSTGDEILEGLDETRILVMKLLQTGNVRLTVSN